MMIKQRTLKHVIHASGIGVHSGKKIYITLRPAVADTGIIFRRVDCNPVIEIPARSEYVVDTRMNTTLGIGTIYVATVEHLLSAMAGLGIDNAYIDINGEEMPIMDGSASPFVFLLESVGIEELSAPKKFIRVKKEVVVEKEEKYARLTPYEGFKIDFTIVFDHIESLGTQREVIDLTRSSYIIEVSRARTFGEYSQYEKLKNNNLAQGASFENTIVLDENGKVVNENGLRYSNEFVRHKILDAAGDLYLLGYNLIGAYTAYKAGHALTNQLVKALLADQSAWEIISLPAPSAAREEDIARASFYFSPLVSVA